MKKLTTRWYYSLYDIYRLYAEDSTVEWPLDVPPTEGLATTLCYIVNKEGLLSEESGWPDLDTTESEKMFAQYLWPEFRDAPIIYVDQEVDPWEITDEEEPDRDAIWEAFKPIVPKMIRWLEESTERYGELISLQTSIASKLLDRLGNESVTLFNDTPQNSGSFVENGYVTNATKVTSEVDVATPIARLREIQDNLRNYYKDWANEYGRFVIYSA